MTMPLVHGATIVVVSDAIREEPHLFWALMVRQQVSLLNCTPSFFGSIVQERPEAVSFDHLVLGGEILTTDLQKEISRAVNIARITNLYGPTETTIDAVGHVVTEHSKLVCTSRSAVLFLRIVFTFWMTVLSLFHLVLRVSCTLRVWSCARVPEPFGVDVGAVCRGPAWCAGFADVPDRGPGAVARRTACWSFWAARTRR